jgi:hypothetical protein
MTDEILIVNFLEKNYEVKTDKSSFIVFDKYDEKTMLPNVFNSHFIKLFSEFMIDDNNTSKKILFDWLSDKKKVLTKNLYIIFDELDSTKRSQKQLETVLKICDKKYKYKYHHDFITNLFLDYYKDKHIIPKLEKHKNAFNTNLGSINLIDDFQDDINMEHPQLITFAKDYLNTWYSETVIGVKIKDLLSQLVITLGTRNWVVTWIGHGPLSKSKLLNVFANENEFHHKFILDMYDEWYGEAVIKASEKIFKNESFSSRIIIK